MNSSPDILTWLCCGAGLTIPQVMYNAQMIRTLSLLLRTAKRRGVLFGGRQVIAFPSC